MAFTPPPFTVSKHTYDTHDAGRIPERYAAQAHAYVEASKRANSRWFLGCDALHPECSCFEFSGRRLLCGGPFSVRMYAPLHLVTFLLTQRNRLGSWRAWLTMFKSLARSLVFVNALIVGAGWVNCASRRLRGRDDGFNPIIAGFVSGILNLNIEPAHRRKEIALWIVPRYIESSYRFLNRRGLLPSLPHFDVALFVGIWSVLMLYLEHKPALLKSSYRWLLGSLVSVK